jgi:hypothetical protein
MDAREFERTFRQGIKKRSDKLIEIFLGLIFSRWPFAGNLLRYVADCHCRRRVVFSRIFHYKKIAP